MEKIVTIEQIPSRFLSLSSMPKEGGHPVSIIPIATAAQLVPVALVAGRVATDAIGSFAGMLRDAVNSPDSAHPVEAAPSIPNTTPQGLTTLLRDFASAFNRLLKNHNLDSGSDVQLTLGTSGDVEVANSHPLGSAIQNLVAKTPQLSELFRQISTQATAHRKEQEFAAFQANSNSPAENFPLLFSGENAPKFHLAVQGNNATSSFA